MSEAKRKQHPKKRQQIPDGYLTSKPAGPLDRELLSCLQTTVWGKLTQHEEYSDFIAALATADHTYNNMPKKWRDKIDEMRWERDSSGTSISHELTPYQSTPEWLRIEDDNERQDFFKSLVSAHYIYNDMPKKWQISIDKMREQHADRTDLYDFATIAAWKS